MSQQELEQGDQEVMGIVNDHAHPDATVVAEEIAEQMLQPEDPERIHCDDTCQCGANPDWNQNQKTREGISTGVCVAACLLVAVLLVAAKLFPAIVSWVVNAGVLCCGIVAAVKIDRAVRRWRNW